jgi:hypothetical protein
MAFTPTAAIAVEAKANEYFDDLVSTWIFREEERNPRLPSHRTKVIQQYSSALGIRSVRLLDIRYQLLQRTLCAAITARRAQKSHAWMIVQAFGSNTHEGYSGNKSDYERYLDVVGSAPELYGMRVQLAWASEGPFEHTPAPAG